VIEPNGKGRLGRQMAVVLSAQECPACGSTERWDAIHVEEDPGYNPAIIVQCDCGRGELKIIVE